jgi:hypothetical protein
VVRLLALMVSLAWISLAGCGGVEAEAGVESELLASDEAELSRACKANADCGKWRVCINGYCEQVCRVGLTMCSSGCVNLATDRLNCGSCGKRCMQNALCRRGVCTHPPQ